MPKYYYEKYAIEVRTNEHNHKGQRAHVHIYVRGEAVASMFLDGTLRDGSLSGRDLRKVSKIIQSKAETYQELWDEYQRSEY
ncbi:DUF4160 domain-containing protein [Lactococcus lactis]|uniref:DUF4160 domain-containing protein n=1 Tax=Lactococcus lactis TaxID=1358 RepID=UPI001912EAFF|nr:DUF4160 domain-containing protein [Lactococcus lactis]MBK5076288.1 DUF4160 domain-containing protein [Lactococcus lactis]WDA68700.1 DUF4160 domain-containing protein [Lactococcus lactis]WDA68890.1 DUF4160 domain-containing protein [Lactococcus lactis]